MDVNVPLDTLIPQGYADLATGNPVAGIGSPETRRTSRQRGFFHVRQHGTLWAGRAGSREARRFLVPVFQPAGSAHPVWKRGSGKKTANKEHRHAGH